MRDRVGTRCTPSHNQVQRDFEELPSAAALQLRDSLLQLLVGFCQGSPPVRTQLCIALAACAAHLPAPAWGQQGVLGWLRDMLGQQPRPIALSCLLEMLVVLPQVRALPTTDVIPTLINAVALMAACTVAGRTLHNRRQAATACLSAQIGAGSCWRRSSSSCPLHCSCSPHALQKTVRWVALLSFVDLLHGRV